MVIMRFCQAQLARNHPVHLRGTSAHDLEELRTYQSAIERFCQAQATRGLHNHLINRLQMNRRQQFAPRTA